MGYELKVIFLPEHKTVFCLPGITVMEAAARCGIILRSPCGGEGTCGKCRVRVKRGRTETGFPSPRLISVADRKKGVRLACQTRIFSPAVIEIPARSRFYREKLPPPAAAGNRTPEKAKAARYGLALDLGTTTVVGLLVNLDTGGEAGEASLGNLQAVRGDDVISRINYVIRHEHGLEEMHARIARTVNEIIGELSERSGIRRAWIRRAAAAGNSAMQHLFLQKSPAGLGTLPFQPLVKEEMEVAAEKIGLELEPGTPVFVFPAVAGFVGGDTVGMILAAGMDKKANKVRLAVDVGTNGEIVLAAGGRLFCASTAAGPAFEGARISCGIRAQPGAIEKVILADDVEISVIGGVRPKGICGSGVLDCAAELVRKGIIDAGGRILSAAEVGDEVSPKLKRRIVRQGTVHVFLLVEGADAADGRPVFFTQRDVREFQAAKAALRSGIKLLAAAAGIEEEDIDEVLLAGAFGNFIRPEAALWVGLVPPLDVHRLKFVGNACLTGVKKVLLSRAERRKLKEIVRQAGHVNLSECAGFQDEFVAAMRMKNE